MITRRQVLARLLGGSVALAAADIWIPGERGIFLPPRALTMADIITVTVGPLIAGGDWLKADSSFTLICPGVFQEPQVLTGYDTAVEFFTDGA